MSLFFEVADIRLNNSHEAIAQSYCDETLPNSRRQTVETPETLARNQAQHDFPEDNSFPTEQFTILQIRTQFIR